MPPRPGAPCANAIIRTDEVVAREGGIVPVRPSLDQLPVDLGPSVTAAVVCAQRIAKGARRRG